MGTVPEELLLQCVVASRGLDVTQNVSVHYDRDPTLLRDAAPEALPALRATLAFLKADAEIPHVRLLPLSLPVPVLARFFTIFPEPNARVRTLLARWTWRVMLGEMELDDRTLLRRAVATVAGENAEEGVQRLLSLTNSDRQIFSYLLPPRFDARSARSRFSLLAMANLTPLDVQTGGILDVAAIIKENGGTTRSIWSVSKGADKNERTARSSPANRVLLPGNGLARRELTSLAEVGRTDTLSLSRHRLLGRKRYDERRHRWIH